ncbi:DNA-3-methyladenine glycosylase [Mesorhizobium sp. M0478]
MLNVSNETPGTGIGVLITAFEPLERIEIMRANRSIERLRDLARGPGRLSQALRIDRSLEGLDLCRKGLDDLDAITTASHAVAMNPVKLGRATRSAF